MKWIKVLLVILGMSYAINYFRQGHSFPLPQVLPGGSGVTSDRHYLWAGAIALAIIFWGLGRLGQTESTDPTPEMPEDDDFEEPTEPESDEESSSASDDEA